MRLLILISAIALVSAACSIRRPIDSSTTPVEDSSKDKQIENLSSALSRAQSRIEELDAKMSSLSDKVDATRLTVDNVTGNKPLKVENVGSAREETVPNPEDRESKSDIVKPLRAATEDRLPLRLDGATGDFVKAMNLFKSGKYTDSELAFSHFTEVFPEHILAGSAQFFAGESYFMLGEYKLAINEYGKVISSFSSSPRVPSAMVRLSHCYEETGNATEASRTLALAHELYDGNPSLDWSAPTKKTAAVTTTPTVTPTPKRTLRADLKATPMEPEAHTEAHQR